MGRNLPANAIHSFSTIAYSASNYAVSDQSEDDVKQQAKRFNEYFTALDSFLGDDVVSTVTEKNTDSAYEYDTKMTVKGKDFSGETVTK